RTPRGPPRRGVMAGTVRRAMVWPQLPRLSRFLSKGDNGRHSRGLRPAIKNLQDVHRRRQPAGRIGVGRWWRRLPGVGGTLRPQLIVPRTILLESRPVESMIASL